MKKRFPVFPYVMLALVLFGSGYSDRLFESVYRHSADRMEMFCLPVKCRLYRMYDVELSQNCRPEDFVRKNFAGLVEQKIVRVDYVGKIEKQGRAYHRFVIGLLPEGEKYRAGDEENKGIFTKTCLGSEADGTGESYVLIAGEEAVDCIAEVSSCLGMGLYECRYIYSLDRVTPIGKWLGLGDKQRKECKEFIRKEGGWAEDEGYLNAGWSKLASDCEDAVGGKLTE